jgi:hypothetical protein
MPKTILGSKISVPKNLTLMGSTTCFTRDLDISNNDYKTTYLACGLKVRENYFT